MHLAVDLAKDKRLFAAEEFSTSSKDDPNKATSRILLNRYQFSRVIGKGGQTIAHVRGNTGVYMKGTDIDEDNRIVLISGSIDQVLAAFDMITDFLVQGTPEGPPPQPPQRPDNLQINLLLEHTKAGKAVGSKGSMMQTIKVKSGAASIRIEKEPLDMMGQQLRKLTIEGNIVAVRRAHLIVLELYAEPSTLQMSAAYMSYLNTGGTPIVDMGGNIPRGPGFGGQPPFEAPMQPPTPVDPNTGTHMVSVPFQQLVNFGVQAETVRQLTEMKAYLWRHFGLDLTISREVVAPQAMPMNRPSAGGQMHDFPPLPPGGRPGPPGQGAHLHGGAPLDSIIDNRGKPGGGYEITFQIPKSSVGAVIGRSGANLRDLQAEYGVRIYVEKDDHQGKRTVVLSATTELTEMDGANLEVALQRCREHIERIVDDQSRQKATQSTSGSQQQLNPSHPHASCSRDDVDND